MGLLGFVTKKGAGTTPPLDTRGATLLVAFISNYAPGSAANVTADSQSNSWSGKTPQSIGNIKGRLFCVENPTANEFHTISFSGDGAGIIFAAFSGTEIASAFEEENGYAASSVNGIQPGSVNPDNDGSLIIAGCAVDNSVTQTVDSGFSIIADVAFEGGANEGLALAYKIQSTAASINPQFAGGTATKAAVIMVIKPYVAPPDTDNPDDVTLGSTTTLSATSARFAFTPAEDATTPISGLLWQFDTVNTFDSDNLIEQFVASNSGTYDKTGLTTRRRWYARAKAKDSASPTPNLSVNWSNTVHVDLMDGFPFTVNNGNERSFNINEAGFPDGYTYKARVKSVDEQGNTLGFTDWVEALTE